MDITAVGENDIVGPCEIINKLDMNCDFSSNNNIWARFYGFVVAILNLVG